MNQSSINVKEMAGSLLILCMAAGISKKRQLLLCCDNTGAKGMIVRGNSANVFGRD